MVNIGDTGHVTAHNAINAQLEAGALNTQVSGFVTAAGATKTALDAGYAPRQVPPTSAVAAGVFDRRLSLYNFKPAQFRRVRAAFGRVRAGSGLASVAFCGDSTVGGVGAVPSVSSWPDFVRDILAAKGYTLNGTGMVAAYKASAIDSRWVFGAGWDALSANSNLMTNSTTANTAVFTSTTVGTIASVHYARTGGPFTVSIDGGAAVGVTPAGGNAMEVYSVTGLANTTHTITIVRTSGNVQILGAEVRANATSGLRICNAGIGGLYALALAQTGWYEITPVIASYVAADLTFIMTEVNDATAATVVATYKASMQAAITNLKASGGEVVIVTAIPGSGLDLTAYTAALYELADSNDIPLIDLQDRYGSYTSLNGLGQMFDGLHAKPSLNAEIAHCVIEALAL